MLNIWDLMKLKFKMSLMIFYLNILPKISLDDILEAKKKKEEEEMLRKRKNIISLHKVYKQKIKILPIVIGLLFLFYLFY